MKNVNVLKKISNLLVVLTGIILALLVMILILAKNPKILQKPTISQIEKKLSDVENSFPNGYEGKKIKYGYRLVSESSKWMGPEAVNPENRYAGNNLACKNCHLNIGTKAGSASWVGISNRFPQFRGRENKIGTLEDRINGCMERSMNGKKLPVNSPQMEAMVAYMDWLSEDVPEEMANSYKGFTKVKLPDIAIDPTKGKDIYLKECSSCHGIDGQGVRFTGSDFSKGYLYPPLWGPDSYNHGAGMHRVITAAEFIKANMPFGQASKENPVLSDEEAFLVAAYIDSFDRPLKSNPENDFPDRKLKPVSTPYGPWEDPFTAEQHKYGPYKPMMDYYDKEFGIKKNK